MAAAAANERRFLLLSIRADFGEEVEQVFDILLQYRNGEGATLPALTATFRDRSASDAGAGSSLDQEETVSQCLLRLMRHDLVESERRKHPDPFQDPPNLPSSEWRMHTWYHPKPESVYPRLLYGTFLPHLRYRFGPEVSEVVKLFCEHGTMPKADMVALYLQRDADSMEDGTNSREAATKAFKELLNRGFLEEVEDRDRVGEDDDDDDDEDEDDDEDMGVNNGGGASSSSSAAATQPPLKRARLLPEGEEARSTYYRLKARRFVGLYREQLFAAHVEKCVSPVAGRVVRLLLACGEDEGMPLHDVTEAYQAFEKMVQKSAADADPAAGDSIVQPVIVDKVAQLVHRARARKAVYAAAGAAMSQHGHVSMGPMPARDEDPSASEAAARAAALASASRPENKPLGNAIKDALQELLELGWVMKTMETYSVEMEVLGAAIVEWKIHEALRVMFGLAGPRIYQLLRKYRMLEEKQIMNYIVASREDTRDALYKMMQRGFVQLQEVPRTAERNTSRSIFLWGIDKEAVQRTLTEQYFFTWCRLKAREQHLDENLRTPLVKERLTNQEFSKESFDRLRQVTFSVNKLHEALLELEGDLLLLYYCNRAPEQLNFRNRNDQDAKHLRPASKE